MSDVMLLGVLRMPYDLFWSDKPLSRMQHNSRRLQAADELESRADEIQQLTAKCEALEKENKRIAKRCQTIAQQHYLAKNAAVDIDEKITKEFNL